MACALDYDLQKSLKMRVMFFGKRASAAQIGMSARLVELQQVEASGELLGQMV